MSRRVALNRDLTLCSCNCPRDIIHDAHCQAQQRHTHHGKHLWARNWKPRGNSLVRSCSVSVFILAMSIFDDGVCRFVFFRDGSKICQGFSEICYQRVERKPVVTNRFTSQKGARVEISSEDSHSTFITRYEYQFHRRYLNR